MILTITLNPALDKSTTIEKLVPEKKMRCKQMEMEAGGGGVNICKVIKELGGDCTALFPSGGINGKIIEQLLLDRAIQLKVIPIAGQTRENFSATDLSANAEYRFVQPGDALSQSELENCILGIADVSPVPDIIVFSGSLPPETPTSIVARLAAISKKINAKFIADTSGETLKQALQEGVFMIKPNLSELCFLAGKNYLEEDEIEGEARKIIEKGGCEVIVVSMGPMGALLLTKDLCKRIPAPMVKKVSTIGAGDSMVAGISMMLYQGKSLVDAVMFGVACGSAATVHTGKQLCRKEDVERFYNWIKGNAR